jgi:hypothetical protein
VLIELDGGKRQILHYGGDNSTDYLRTGTLHFFHNTVVSERSSLATVVRLSSADAIFDARNNIFHALGGGDQLGVLEDAGTATLRGNWLPTGWREGSPSLVGSVVTASDNQEGADPGFADAAARDYALTAASTAAGLAVPLATAAEAHPVTMQFAPPSSGSARASAANAGAFE